MERLLHTKHLHKKVPDNKLKAGGGFSTADFTYSNISIRKIHQEINFKEILNEIIKNEKVINSNYQVEINVNIRNEAPFVSDKKYVEIMFNKLISNTLRCQSTVTSLPYVYVKIHSHEAGANISIRNNSIVVKKEEFKILNTVYKRSLKGEEYGFELYALKETIEKLNGRIEVEFQFEEEMEYTIHLPNIYNSCGYILQ